MSMAFALVGAPIVVQPAPVAVSGPFAAPATTVASAKAQAIVDRDAKMRCKRHVETGTRDAVDKVLQRLATADEIRRIGRGLYGRPGQNSLTGQSNPPIPGRSSARSSGATRSACSSTA